MRYFVALGLITVCLVSLPCLAEQPAQATHTIGLYDEPVTYGPVYYKGARIPEAEFGFTDDGDTLYFAGRPFYPTRKGEAQRLLKSREPIPVTWDSKSWHALSCQADQVTEAHLDKSEGFEAFKRLYLDSGLVRPDTCTVFSNGIRVFRLDVGMWTDIFYESGETGTPPTRQEMFDWWQQQFWCVVEDGGTFAWGEDYHLQSPSVYTEQTLSGIQRVERGERLAQVEIQDTVLNSTEFRRDLQRKLNGQ